jgi:RNase P protein component
VYVDGSSDFGDNRQLLFKEVNSLTHPDLLLATGKPKSETGVQRALKRRVNEAMRWSEVKEHLGWISVIVGRAIPAVFRNSNKTSRADRQEKLGQLVQRNRPLMPTVLCNLVKLLPQISIWGLLPGVDDNAFVEWFDAMYQLPSAKLHYDGAFFATFLIAAAVLTHQQFAMDLEMLRQIEEGLHDNEGNKHAWPERGLKALSLADKLAATWIPEMSMP